MSEFKVSKDHPDLATGIEFFPTDKERIRFACASILEPLRLRFGPVIITSGKRTQALNQAVGGHQQSHHLFENDHGACDFVVHHVKPHEVIEFLLNNTRFRYLIHYVDRKFFHLSFPDSTGIYNKYWLEGAN